MHLAEVYYHHQNTLRGSQGLHNDVQLPGLYVLLRATHTEGTAK